RRQRVDHDPLARRKVHNRLGREAAARDQIGDARQHAPGLSGRSTPAYSSPSSGWIASLITEMPLIHVSAPVAVMNAIIPSTLIGGCPSSEIRYSITRVWRSERRPEMPYARMPSRSLSSRVTL